MPFKDPKKRAEYQKEYFGDWYSNPDKKEQQKANVRRRKREIRAWYVDLKRSLKCFKCGLSGEDNPWAIEFHHHDHNEKEMVSYLVANGYSKKRIEEEISKCKPVCANCHRNIHFEERMQSGKSIFQQQGSKAVEANTIAGKIKRKKSRAHRAKKRKEREANHQEREQQEE